jgi:hypothetical protein
MVRVFIAAWSFEAAWVKVATAAAGNKALAPYKFEASSSKALAAATSARSRDPSSSIEDDTPRPLVVAAFCFNDDVASLSSLKDELVAVGSLIFPEARFRACSAFCMFSTQVTSCSPPAAAARL